MSTIIDAQRSRGLLRHRNPFRRVYAFIPLLRPLTFLLMMGAVDRAAVWHHRGLLVRPQIVKRSFAQRDYVALIASSLVLACSIVDRCLHWN